MALAQVVAVVRGHVLGVVLAHERSLRSARRARASDQLPLVAVMVAFTVGGLGLLFGFSRGRAAAQRGTFVAFGYRSGWDRPMEDRLTGAAGVRYPA